jgi:hypothetical protein
VLLRLRKIAAKIAFNPSDDLAEPPRHQAAPINAS